MAEHPVPTIDIAPFVEGGEAGATRWPAPSGGPARRPASSPSPATAWPRRRSRTARGSRRLLRPAGRAQAARRAPGRPHQPRLECALRPLARLFARRGDPARFAGELRHGAGRGAGGALFHLRARGAPSSRPISGRGTARIAPLDGTLLPLDGGLVVHGDAHLRPRAGPRRLLFRRPHRPAFLQPPADPLPRAGRRRRGRPSAGRASITTTARSPSCAATTCRAGSRSSCAMAAGSTWSGRTAGSSAISATR